MTGSLDRVDEMPDRMILRRAEIALRNLQATSKESQLYGARLIAARAWCAEALERLKEMGVQKT